MAFPCGALVGDVDGEGERPLRHRVAPVEDVGHDFVADVEILAGNHRLPRGNEQPHELRCPRRLARRFAQLRNRIELTDGRFLIHPPEHRGTLISIVPTGPRRKTVTSGAFRSSAALIDSVRVPPMSSWVMKFAVAAAWRVPDPGRKELADQRIDRTCPADCRQPRSSSARRRAPCCPGRSTRNMEFFGDLPAADQAYRVGMEEPPEAF